ncbi:hypothetical protein AMECASPLE_000009 [Ameca splendens]|uniref:Uncharacterized protein n=1 Tax=Ameca splendens TaxID=208324 RepID=A0ABV0XXI7_9TELE
MGRIIASLACLPSIACHCYPPIKFLTIIAFPWKPVGEEELKSNSGGKRKSSVVGSLHSSQVYAPQTTNCEPQSMKKAIMVKSSEGPEAPVPNSVGSGFFNN